MKIIEIVATRCQTLRLECIKFDFGWAPDAAGSLQGSPRSPTCIQEAYFKGKGRRKGDGRFRPALVVPCGCIGGATDRIVSGTHCSYFTSTVYRKNPVAPRPSNNGITQFFRVFITVCVFSSEHFEKYRRTQNNVCHFICRHFATVFAYHLHMVGCTMSTDVVQPVNGRF